MSQTLRFCPDISPIFLLQKPLNSVKMPLQVVLSVFEPILEMSLGVKSHGNRHSKIV
jgi:hypothetical protein